MYIQIELQAWRMKSMTNVTASRFLFGPRDTEHGGNNKMKTAQTNEKQAPPPLSPLSKKTYVQESLETSNKPPQHQAQERQEDKGCGRGQRGQGRAV